MITPRRSTDRGRGSFDWLEARYSFSFASYRDPAWDGYSVLRVLNQDRIVPGGGFAPHGHENMEIVTYVLEGTLAHRATTDEGGTLRPGEVQLMSAGTGVRHSEFNASESEPLHLLQMWIVPARRGTAPSYQQADYSDRLEGGLALVASPDGVEDSLRIGQDVSLFAGRPSPGEPIELELRPDRRAWLHLALGALRVNGELLEAGDGAAIEGESKLVLEAEEPSDLVLFDLP